MEDTYPYTKPQTFPTRPKKYSHFICKATIFSIFIYILLLFSPQSSETTHEEGNWELIQLFLVGIAVSYGLFSQKNDETEENLDMMNSYISNIFQASSFFDEGNDDQAGPDEKFTTEMWKSQHFMREPLVVLESKNSIFENHSSATFEIPKNPLFLPVRSLKPRTLEFAKIGSLYFETKVEENSLLKSPIQGNSQSDSPKTEMKKKINETPMFPLPSLSLSPKSKSRDMIGNGSEKSLNGANFGKSVRTIRKCGSVSRVLESRGYIREKNIDLESGKRTRLEIFDFRDYENVISYNSEGFKCNAEIGEERDVDMKADEFIAKFREQIRLQRTESFRR